MTKNLLSLFLLTFFSLTMHAQCTIPNAGFENWVDDDGILVPVDWFGIGGERTTDAQSGTAAILLKNTEIEPGFSFPGILICQIRCNTRPAYLTGYIKTRSNIADSVMLTAIFYRGASGSTPIGFCSGMNSVARNNYVQFHIPIDYSNQLMPDSALIQLSNISNLVSSGVKFDNLAFSATPLGVLLEQEVSINSKILTAKDLKVDIYPMPVKDKATIQISSARARMANIQLIDAQGKVTRTLANKVLSAGINELPLEVKGMQAGLYFIRLATQEGILMKKISVQ